MRLASRFISYVALWLLAECAAFALIVQIIGFVGAMALCTLTATIGVLTLRKVGLSAAMNVFRIVATFGDNSKEFACTREALLDDAITGFGSVLLILPGFVSDFAGLALAAPSLRQKVQVWLQTNNLEPQSRPAILELAPHEWLRLETKAPRPERKSVGSVPSPKAFNTDSARLIAVVKIVASIA
jgi:UPF0716 protein FxsA